MDLSRSLYGALPSFPLVQHEDIRQIHYLGIHWHILRYWSLSAAINGELFSYRLDCRFPRPQLLAQLGYAVRHTFHLLACQPDYLCVV